MAKKSGLGDNFSAIFDDVRGEESGGDGLVTMRVSEIEPNRGQPRKRFDPEKLAVLAESIATHGVIQPLTVRRVAGISGVQLVAGERRWRAAKMAGLREVPVRIMELSDSDAMAIALIENLQREDLNPIEEAAGYKELMDSFGMSQEEVAKVVGRARSSVSNAVRLLALPADVQNMASEGTLSRGHCKALLQLSDPAQISSLAAKAALEGMSVRRLEQLASAPVIDGSAVKKESPPHIKNHFYAETEVHLTEYFGRPVRVTQSGKKYSLTIDFTSEEELREIVGRMS